MIEIWSIIPTSLHAGISIVILCQVGTDECPHACMFVRTALTLLMIY